MSLKDNFYIVDFHFIDDFRCIRPLIEAVDEENWYHFVDPDVDYADGISNEDRERELRARLEALFLEAGWEGDGEVNCIFVPPCLLGRDDGWCDVIFHVKQSNNGTSWLAIPIGMELSLPSGFMRPAQRIS